MPMTKDTTCAGKKFTVKPLTWGQLRAVREKAFTDQQILEAGIVAGDVKALDSVPAPDVGALVTEIMALTFGSPDQVKN